jgi:hypothetical protein
MVKRLPLKEELVNLKTNGPNPRLPTGDTKVNKPVPVAAFQSSI